MPRRTQSAQLDSLTNTTASNVTVSNNRLYGTPGLSIGSDPKFAVSNILFLNNYVYGSDFSNTLSADSNGLVIKQYPLCASTVSQVTYQNTCIKGVKHLITFYTNYSGTCSGTAGSPGVQQHPGERGAGAPVDFRGARGVYRV